MTETEIDLIVDRLTNRLRGLFAPVAHPETDPVPSKLTLAQFAFCIQRSVGFVKLETRINPKLKARVQGRRPKLIHPAALALYGVDPQLAASRLAQWPQPSRE